MIRDKAVPERIDINAPTFVLPDSDTGLNLSNGAHSHQRHIDQPIAQREKSRAAADLKNQRA
jgi:hypothetical protein